MTKVRAGSTEVRATTTLRRLLDERDIHWWAGEDERKTLWKSNGLTWEYFNDENGDAWLGFLGACEQDITPEQAIAATLGPLTERAAKDSEKDSDGRGECRRVLYKLALWNRREGK